MNILIRFANFRMPSFVAMLAMSLILVSHSSWAQLPGSAVTLFPPLTLPGQYVLTMPSVLDVDPKALYVVPKRAGASEIEPSVISEERPRQTTTSLSLGTGYDTAVDDIPHLAGEVILAEGYFGMRQHKRSYDMLLQHDVQLSDSHGTGVGLEQYQLTSASIIPTEYRRTMWSALLENGYGSDSARAAGSISPSSLSNSSLPEFNMADFGFVSGNILTDHGVLGLQHRLTRSRTAEIQGGAYYHHFFELGTSDQQYSLSGLLSQRWTANQTFGAQAEVVQEHYTTLDCTNGSISFRSTTQLTGNTHLEGGIGPVWGSSSCARTFEYSISLTSTTPNQTSYYVGSAREPANGFVDTATWEDSTFAGLAIGHARRLMGRIDAGYSRYLVANPTLLNPNQKGYFFSGELHHRLSDIAEISLMARYFYCSEQPINLNRSVFLVRYTWSREERPTHIQALGGRNATQ